MTGNVQRRGQTVRGVATASLAAVVVLLSPALLAQRVDIPLSVFAKAASPTESDARDALAILAADWHDRYAAILLELAEMSRGEPVPAAPATLPGVVFTDPFADPGTDRPDGPPSLLTRSPVRERLLRFLDRQTGRRFGEDFERWHEWVWSLPYDPHSEYVLFKGLLYANIDPRMRDFFPPDVPARIRLDEVEWGGVVINGIPPLLYPKHIPAGEASYLRDGHIVFGLHVNGEARAYPKRILAWHELARDELGGRHLTVVYCTLCGTVIPYDSEAEGQGLVRLNTSGLLYRSNKLMFDEETKSLWSTLEGKPVIGPLVKSGVALRPYSAVTTTWGEWRRMHPTTTVLSLDTGHDRDYSEGAAYRDYFSHDRLMFSIPAADNRLRNKDEVLVMRITGPSGELVPVAIAADFLRRRRVFHAEVAGRPLVIVTTRNGANRVYEAADQRFRQGPSDLLVVDGNGATWQVTEDALLPAASGASGLPRLPAQRAFWFGWHAQFPDTLLIK